MPGEKFSPSFKAVDTERLFVGDDGPATSFADIGGGIGFGDVRSAADFSGATDGIWEAMDDLPDDGSPGYVLIPKGGGSGTDGEYVMSDTFELSNAYSGGYGTPSVCVKADRPHTWFVSNGATVTVEAGTQAYAFLVSSYNDTQGQEIAPSNQIENVHIYGLRFDGKGRDNSALTHYESRACSVEFCYFTDWQPVKKANGGEFFDDMPIRCQHHADDLTYRNNVFRLNQGNKAVVKNDGGRRIRYVNNSWLSESGATNRAARTIFLTINNDFNRAPMNCLFQGNRFDFRGLNIDGDQVPTADLKSGIGLKFKDNEFMQQFDTSAELVVVNVAGLNYTRGRRGMVIADNEFVNGNPALNFINDAPRYGDIIRGNSFYHTETGNNFDRKSIEFQNTADLEDAVFVDNRAYNIAGTNTGDAVNDENRLFEFTNANLNGCAFRGNKTHDMADWYQGTLPSNCLFEDNESVGDPPINNAAPKQRAKGRATSVSDAGTIAHGLDFTPSLADVSLESESANNVWPSAVDATNITVQVEGSGTADVRWRVDARPSWAL